MSPLMLERYAFFVLVAAAVMGILGFLWLVTRAFRQRALWGFGVLLMPPVGFLFLYRHFGKAAAPTILMVLAAITGATPYAVSYYERHFVPPKPYEQIVDGELRITLTGMQNFDYSTLRSHPDLVVLQMANADVGDATLSYLAGMDRLRALDINDSEITDEGLRSLATLPRLQELNLARTHISDDGFRTHLGSKESLLKLNVTGTDIKGKTLRDWKKAKPDMRDYVN
jgi:Leucine Rich repeat